MPFLLLATEIFRRQAGEAFRETQGRYAAIQAFLQEQLSGISLVQLNARETSSRDAFAGLNRSYLDAFIRTIFAYAVFFPVVEFITSATLAALILFAGYKLQAGALTMGLLLAFIQQSGRFFRPIRELAERYNVMQTAMASSERIFKLLDNQDEIREIEHAQVPTFRHELRLEEVSFAYDEGGAGCGPGAFGGHSPGASGSPWWAIPAPGRAPSSTLLMRFYDVGKGAHHP